VFRGKFKTIHFVGIGGIGMSGIAEVLLTLGFSVTGSDVKEGKAVKHLRSVGAKVSIGHAAENLGTADVVVRSTAVGIENPEIAAALASKVPVIRRAEMLSELMRLKYGIAVAGSHGKTTTTSMLAVCLSHGGLDPTVVIGGRVASLGGVNARHGQGEYLLAEADESDGTFLLLSPTIALITNIDPEHLDHYGSVQALEDTFVEFANRVPFYGFSVLCQDHPTVQRLMPRIRRKTITYGLSRQADYRGVNLEPDGITTRFDLYRQDEQLGTLEIPMPGVHNVTNAIGAAATSIELGISFAEVAHALANFSGVERRFTIHGEFSGVSVVDDYAHHPTELEATLAAAETAYADRRVIAVVQPHRYSRVRDLWPEFCACFNQADVLVLCPIYAAGEDPIPGIDHETLAAGVRQRGHRNVIAVSDLQEAKRVVLEMVQPSDVVITMGAGTIGTLPPLLAKALS